MMTVRKTGQRLALVVVMVCGAVVGVDGGVAQARAPWWHVNTISAPPAAGGEEGRLVLEVSDLGDAMVDGRTSQVRIVDRLPAGVEVLHVYGQGGGGNIGKSIGAGRGEGEAGLPCAVSGSAATGERVECTYGSILLAYERFMVAVTVRVLEPGAGDGVNEVLVSGGGAAPVVARRVLSLEEVGSYGAENWEFTPEGEGGSADTQAGSHPFQLTTTMTLNTRAVFTKKGILNKGIPGEEVLPEVQPVGLAKDVRVDLPVGFFGNPTPLPKCNIAVFTRDPRECPEDTVVGVATSIVTNSDFFSNVPLAETLPLYSLEPSVGEPARFGFNTSVGPVILDASVSPQGAGYHVVVTVPDILDNLTVIGSQVTFWGVPADGRHDTTRGACVRYATSAKQVEQEGELSCPGGARQPFLVLPTSCTGPLASSVSSDSWEAIGAYSPPKLYTSQTLTGEPYGQDGCSKLNFEPSISVAPDGRQGSTPTGLNVNVHVSQKGSLNPDGLAESTVRDTTVALPPGVALNPAGANGLLACGLGEVGLGGGGEQACPEASKVGTVEIATPLLPKPLVGAAYIAAQEANPFGSLLALYLVVYDEEAGVRVKIAGEVKPDPVTGQLVSTFTDTPNLPFEDLRLHFFGGSRAPLGTPAACGSYTTTASFAPWSGNPASSVVSPPFEITSGPNGSPCRQPLPFEPSLTAGSVNLQAGAFTPFTTTMSREDGNQSLQAIQLKMPPGLLGTLSGVELCPEPQADQGTCGPNSLIGETTVSVGLGGDPYTVTGGKVYITGPYEGAPYGLSIVNPAKAGPFDLERTSGQHPACDCLVVRARIEVNPITAALTVTTDDSGPHRIPQIIEGIPLQIKHVNVTINRAGFTFNPTNCSPMAITGTLTGRAGLSSSEETTRGLSVPFQVTNCATLKFKPVFKVWTTGRTSRKKGAGLRVKLTYPKAPFGTQANIAKVRVDLPRQLPSRLSTLQQACPDRAFENNPAACPSGSRVGYATATTPVIPVPLQGPAYFVSHGGAKFPELIIVLSGYGTTVELHGETFISKKSITSSTFRTIPDVPVGTFELTLPQAANSALAANGNLCRTKLNMPTSFVAANGRKISQTTRIAVTNCPKGHKHNKKRSKNKIKHK